MPGLTVGDDLGDHRVEIRRYNITHCNTGVNAHTGSGRKPEPFNQSRCRCEPVLRIFGVQANFNGVAVRCWRLAFQPLASGNLNLQLHQVQSGRTFGDGMLDLQPGVHLHEQETLARWLVQELDCAGVPIAGHLAQPNRRSTQRQVLLCGKHGRRRLFHDLLVASLDGAVAHSHGPRGSIVIGDDLDLNVTGPLDELLHENRGVTKCLECLGTCALERAGELVGGLHPANPMTAAAGGRLDQQRIA